VARLGGGEFTVLLDDLARPDEAEAVVARIQAAVARPFDLGGHEVYTSASIGVALSTVGYASAEEVLRDADTAMYKAKQAGKARHVVFDPEMHSTAVELLSLETDLRRAAERGELGCDAGQGFLFSSPVGAEEAEALLPKESGGAAVPPVVGSEVREVGDRYAM
jgi:predicted signal transduction protein with EAL and GGDEF domain